MRSIYYILFFSFFSEEVFGSDHALWWSTKGKYILYAQFDDRHVQKFDYPFYGDLTNVYVKQEKIAYPKVIIFNIYTVDLIIYVSFYFCKL